MKIFTARCFHVKDLEKKKPLALKLLSCENIKEVNKGLKELTSLIQLNHENLIKYLDVFITDDDGYMLGLVMPYYGLGDLKKFIRSKTMKEDFLKQQVSCFFI
jgi:serine/threonine protein kinase